MCLRSIRAPLPGDRHTLSEKRLRKASGRHFPHHIPVRHGLMEISPPEPLHGKWFLRALMMVERDKIGLNPDDI